jgi:hypothetical protein
MGSHRHCGDECVVGGVDHGHIVVVLISNIGESRRALGRHCTDKVAKRDRVAPHGHCAHHRVEVGVDDRDIVAVTVRHIGEGAVRIQ